MSALARRTLGLIALFAWMASAAAVTVSMSSPSNGTLYLAPATLPVKANASATGVGIARVEFYANGTLIRTVSTSPYQFDWSGIAAGSYSVNAIAYDNNGAQATSASRSITVAATNTPPTVSLTAPADGSRYLNLTSITISANASGPELNDIVQRVDFYLNGTLANSITQAPFSYGATGLALGTYTLTAVATDSQGAQSTSAARTFTVSNTNVPPSVSLVIPQDNTRWNSPATVTFQANASSGEANDTVSVSFYANGTLIGTKTSAPFSLSSTLAANTYTITAVATDGQGASTTSAARTIVVSDTNLPPTISITAPSGGANYPTAPAGFTLSASANAGEVNGWVTKVEFYLNGTLVNTDTAAPWSFNVSGLANGSYTLTAKAFDQLNAITTSAPVTITVGPQPKLHFVHVDHLNTPRAVYDDQQRLEWKWEQQEPFGVNVPDENPSGLGVFKYPLRHPGQYDDKETGLLYANQRDCYDPATGRFCQADPVGVAGLAMAGGQIPGLEDFAANWFAMHPSPNLTHSSMAVSWPSGELPMAQYAPLSLGLSLYAYVDNNPLRFTDPLGLNPNDKWYGFNDKNFRDYVHGIKQEWGLPGNYQFDKKELENLYKCWEEEGKPRGKGGKSGKGGRGRDWKRFGGRGGFGGTEE